MEWTDQRSVAVSTGRFVHLHCHSHFSLLDGASRIERLVEKTVRCGMTALALTDHGNLYGALKFYTLARKAGINPILGMEAYVAPGSRFKKETVPGQESSYHLTLLAMNRRGFKNLIKLSSKAFLEGFYRKPRVDHELLAQYHEGIICLSGCVSGEFAQAILRRKEAEPDYKEAEEIARWFSQIFGDRYYIEVQDNGLEIQRIVRQAAVDIARRLGVPVVATSDAHYVEQEDHDVQDILLCVNTGKFRSDQNRLRMETNQFHLRTPEEMYEVFSDLPDALERTQEIADRVDIDLELGKPHFPVYQLPEGTTAEELLRKLCIEGLKRRYANNPQRMPNGQLAPEVMERLERELAVICKLGFANYFLIVWDVVRFATSRGILCSARGSGVGALVSYALGISHVCPLEYDLLFERFLDENRPEPPDIDIDFCKERRAEVIDYVRQKYGEENVAQIGTFGTLQPRNAIRDVGRVLGWSVARVDALVSLVPNRPKITVDEALQESEELRQKYQTDPEVRELIDFARKIEGLARNAGTHAAGVVIADKPLMEYLPLQKIPGKDDVVTQWDKDDVERAGLLKMDFLGLRNLTILSKAVELIEKTTGRKIDIYNLPLDDKKTFELLCRGETKGIFQLEGGGIRELLQRMKPDSFRDIIATNALYRPGPLEGGMVDDYILVKHGKKKPVYKHPVMKEVLEETYGVMVYQEQVMRILNRLGGIPLADAYKCIKAISKKKLEIIQKYKEQFLQGATAQGLSQKEADELFGMIEKFAGYGFNKSHSTAYAKISYTTAYLKAHFPVEFMAALLCGDIPQRNFKSKDSLVEHLEDCQRMGIEVCPPDVNQSWPEFTVDGGRILFGLTAIKGCGAPAAEAICRAREEGPFRDLYDFCRRVDPSQCGRSTMESLIKAGAMDCFGWSRAQLMAALDAALNQGAAHWQDRRAGQRSLFGSGPAQEAPPAVAPQVPDWDEKEKLQREREVLGFYWSSHPLDRFQDQLARCTTHTVEQLAQVRSGAEVSVGGMISAIRFGHTRNARPDRPSKYAMFDLEDRTGTVRCILWPDAFAQCGQLVQPDSVVVAQARVERRDTDTINLIVNRLLSLEEAQHHLVQRLHLHLNPDRHGPGVLELLRQVLQEHRGPCEVELVLHLENGARVWMPCPRLGVKYDGTLRGKLDELLGPGCVQLVFRSGENGASAPRRSLAG